MLVIVCGLQGSGKTTVAKRIAKRLKAKLLRTDVIRKKIAKKPKYTDREKQKIYANMFSMATILLKSDKNVVLDATFAKRTNRLRAKNIAKQAKTNFKIIKVIATESVIKKRLGKRSKDASEAKISTYLKHKRLFEPIKEPHTVINNSETISELNKKLREIKLIKNLFFLFPVLCVFGNYLFNLKFIFNWETPYFFFIFIV